LQAQATWVPRFAASNPWPKGVVGATATFEATRQRVVVIGGETLGLTSAIDNVREWNGWDWQRIVTTTPLPVRVYHAAASQWPQPGILVHGGTPYVALLDERGCSPA